MSEEKSSFQFIKGVIEKTVKGDSVLSEHILLTAESAYSQNPNNLAIMAPTSEGKTYAVTQILDLFPKKDVLFLAGMSPTAFYYEHGELVDEDLKPIKDDLEDLQLRMESGDPESRKEAKDEHNSLNERSQTLISLANKILVFLDAPNRDLFDRLKPILSHDRYDVAFKITQERRGSGHSAKTIIVRGWPATIFCSARNEKKWESWPEIQSRFNVVSPSMNPEKYGLANILTAKRKGLPQSALENIYPEDEREKARDLIKVQKERILLLRSKSQIGNPQANIHWIPFHTQYANAFPNSKGTDMREFNRFITYLQMSALAHMDERPILTNGRETSIIVVRQDQETVSRLLPNGQGVNPYKMNWYREFFVPCEEAHKREMTEKGLSIEKIALFCASKGKPLTKTQIRDTYLDELEEYNVVNKEKDIDNLTRNLYLSVDGVIAGTGGLTNPSFYSLRSLKEAQNELIRHQIENPVITYDSRTLTVEELFEWFFDQPSILYHPGKNLPPLAERSSGNGGLGQPLLPEINPKVPMLPYQPATRSPEPKKQLGRKDSHDPYI